MSNKRAPISALFALVTVLIAPAAVLAPPSPAWADQNPPPSPAPSNPGQLPSLPGGLENNPYVRSVLNAINGLLQSTNGNTAHGKVTYFKQYDMQLELAPKVYRQVKLHPGTIINPRGTTLTPGMIVDVTGNAQNDGSLNADSITLR